MIRCGDVIDIAAEDETYTACLTDPPYGLSLFGAHWDRGVPGSPYWAEVLRVLKPGGVLLAFSGTRTHHRLYCAIEDAGFEIFDTLMWVYSAGFPKSHNISKAIDKEAGALTVGTWQPRGTARIKGGRGYEDGELRSELPITPLARIWDGYGTGLKPAVEFICCARKPREATYAQTAVEHGTGALNIDGCRVGVGGKVREIAGSGISWYGGQKDTYELGTRTRYHYRGRWPPNLLLQHSPGCVKVERGDQSNSYGHKWECVDACAVRRLGELSAGRLAARFFPQFGWERWCYAPKASRAERDAGLEAWEGLALSAADYRGTRRQCAICGCTSVGGEHTGDIPGQMTCGHSMAAIRYVAYDPDSYHNKMGKRNPHPTVKPLSLCKWLATLIRPPEEYDATLFVPFAGVGSEMIGAYLAGWRNVVGIEKEQDYVEVAEARIAWWRAKMQETGLNDPRAILNACGMRRQSSEEHGVFQRTLELG